MAETDFQRATLLLNFTKSFHVAWNTSHSNGFFFSFWFVCFPICVELSETRFERWYSLLIIFNQIIDWIYEKTYVQRLLFLCIEMGEQMSSFRFFPKILQICQLNNTKDAIRSQSISHHETKSDVVRNKRSSVTVIHLQSNSFLRLLQTIQPLPLHFEKKNSFFI